MTAAEPSERSRPEEPFAPNPKQRIWIDGEFLPADQARISVFDHGLLYGDGVFEGIRVYNRNIFLEQEHIKRLYESAKCILLNIPITPDQLSRALAETVRLNGIEEGYIRVIVTRGAGLLGLAMERAGRPSVIIIAGSIQHYSPESYERGLRCITAATLRNHPATISPRIKSLNYLNNVLAKAEATNAGADEAVMLNPDGYVAEATGSNIFVARDGKLLTPPPSAGILEGITRRLVMELARKRNHPTIEANLVRQDVYVADECFLTGTATEIVPVVSLDHRSIGDGSPGTITRMLMADFVALRNRLSE